MFGKSKRAWLEKFLDLEYGIPDTCTLKANQSTLYNDVKLYLDNIREEEEILKSPYYHKTIEKGHGREKVRECYICVDWLSGRTWWENLN